MAAIEGIKSSSRRKAQCFSDCSSSTPQTIHPSSRQTESLEQISDFCCNEEPLSLDALISSLPGRKPQILEILHQVGRLNSPMSPLLIYGGPSSGKTVTIIQFFCYLNRPFVYTSCRTCYSARVLFDSVLKQLLPYRKNSGKQNYGTRRCGNSSELIDLLRIALVEVVNALSESKPKNYSVESDRGKMIYLIFDNFEILSSWKKSSSIVPLLLRIHDTLQIPEVGIIYISSSTPDAYYLSAGFINPATVRFPDYTMEDLRAIFMRNQPNPKLYAPFLSVVLKPLFSLTRRVDELSVVFQFLFRKYCEPLVDQYVVPDVAMKRMLYYNFHPYLAASLKDLFMIITSSCSHQNKQEAESSNKGIRKPMRKGVSNDLDLHMPMSAKYLLLSAFISSRNPATLDAALFDFSGLGSAKRKRKKNSQKSIVRKDSMDEENFLKGPGSFPLERLLAIFYCITSIAESTAEEEQNGNDVAVENETVGLISDVLLQLSTLCDANFIRKGGSCSPLEGSSTRYRCTIEEEMAVKVARSINFPLSSYLYRR